MSAQKKSQPEILIAGGATLLGSRLASSLVSQNCNVTIVDNLASDTNQNLQNLTNSPNFKFITADITKVLPENLGKFTHVYHLAGVEEYLTEARLTHANLLVNSAGTENLLKLAKRDDAKFILVSTLDVYAGIISQTSMENYFGAAKFDFSHFSHHEAKRFAESLTASYFQNFSLDCSIARIAQVYGPGMNLASGDVIAQLINQALTTETLIIPGDGLEVLHPTYLDDVVWGLVKIGFSTNTTGGIYNLVDPAEFTVLEFAGRLKEIFAKIDEKKELEIVFEKDGRPVKFPIPKLELTRTEHDLGWMPKVNLAEGLLRTLEFFLQKKESFGLEKEIPTAVEHLDTTRFQLPKISFSLPKITLPPISISFPKTFSLTNLAMVAVFLLTLFLLILPLGQVVIGLGFGLKNFQEGEVALLAADFKLAEIKAKQTVANFQVATGGLARLNRVFFWGKWQSFDNLNQNIQGLAEASLGFESLVEISKTASILARDIISGENGNFDKTISQLNLEFAKATTDFETAKLDLSDFKLRKIPGLGQNAQDFISQLTKNLPNLKKAANFAKLLPEFLGLEGEKTYLVLFLNNAELRPGGGFIGSYGIFKFENGKLTPPLIDDIYNLDGQLKISIPPPEPLKKYLGVNNWSLHDSNWHYDFAQNGAAAAIIYAQITGETVDGVIGVDVETFTNLLKVLGPVKLADYDEEITASNLSERAEYYAEIGFFPGSTSKKDFLSTLARQIILKLQQDAGVNYFEMIKTLAALANEKHLIFYFKDPKLATFFADVNWSGQIRSISTQTDGQIKVTRDYLAISEANVGANKSNRFLERKIKFEPVILRDGDLITTLTIDYVNRSPAPTWPGGNYKNYLRIITPIGTKLEQVIVSDQDVTAVTEQLAEFDKQVFGVFLEVPAGEASKVIIKFRQNYRIEVLGDKATYNLLIQKQPGTGADPISIDLSYPGYLKVSKTNLPAKPSEQKVNLEQKLSKDFDFKVEFSL